MVRILDGRYPMGELIVACGKAVLRPAYLPFADGNSKGIHVSEFMRNPEWRKLPWNHSGLGSIRPKGEDYRRQLYTVHRRDANGEEITYIVFPDFRIRSEKLTPFLSRLPVGTTEIQYSTIKKMVDRGLC